MNRSIPLLLQIGFWICFGLLFLLMATLFNLISPNGPTQAYTFKLLMSFALIPGAISFYASYFSIFPRFFQQRKIVLGILLMIGVSLLSSFIGQLTLSLFIGFKVVFAGGISGILGKLLTSGIIALLAGVVSILIRGFATWYNTMKRHQELQEKNHAMELALVKAQLDPHFLFNTINNIDVLILKAPEKASEYLNQLSHILRFMLFETKTERIPLQQELEYLKKYVGLQKIRGVNPEFALLNVKGEPNGKTIAPMVFLPFVENAFKHAGSKDTKGAISIEVNILQNSIEFRCVNSIRQSQNLASDSGGLGNSLMQQRLELLYPDQQFQLNTEVVNGNYQVNLTLHEH